MQRLLKRLLHKRVPHWMVQRIRGSIEDRLNSGPVLPFTVTPAGVDALRCFVADKYNFLTPVECDRELNYHTHTSEGRAELSGIAQGALRGGTLFDIGAHAGLISAIFCAAKPGNIVYSFEPSPLAKQRLLAMRELNCFGERMQLEPVAIGRAHARLEMLCDPGGGQVQVQRFEHSMWDEPQTIEVNVETLAEASARLGVIPDFIKLDIESYEYEAIDGARDFLARHKPELFIELHLNYLEERKLSPRSLVTMLRDCGYAFFTYGGTELRAAEIYDSPLQGIRFVARAKR